MSEWNENLIRVVVGKDPNGHPFTGVETPLTLRDFFAAFALLTTEDYPRDIRAQHAYEQADAMLAERRKAE